MTGTPLIIGQEQRDALAELRELAAERPVDMTTLTERIATPKGKAAHMLQMNDQTCEIPLAFLITYSIETGHPIGPCRHMSISSTRRGDVPTAEAAWMVAEELGFVGGLEKCRVWIEDLQRGPQARTDRALAINIVQPLDGHHENL